jgi:hypothetical protein
MVICFASPTAMLFGRLKSNIRLTNVVKKTATQEACLLSSELRHSDNHQKKQKQSVCYTCIKQNSDTGTEAVLIGTKDNNALCDHSDILNKFWQFTCLPVSCIKISLNNVLKSTNCGSVRTKMCRNLKCNLLCISS